MIFELLDGRDHLFQWDLNRKLAVKNETIKEVHFCNRTSDCSLVVEVVDGIANIPNILLQNSFDIKVYGYDGEATLYESSFAVKARTRPSSYIYEETDVIRLEDFEERIIKEIDEKMKEVEEGLIAEGFATTDYIDEAVSNIEIPTFINLTELFGEVNSVVENENLLRGLNLLKTGEDVILYINGTPLKTFVGGNDNSDIRLTPVEYSFGGGGADLNSDGNLDTVYAEIKQIVYSYYFDGMTWRYSARNPLDSLWLNDLPTIHYVDNAIANIEIPESSGSINEYATQDFKIDSTGTYYKINVDGTTEALAPEIVDLGSFNTGINYENIYNFFKSQILRCEHTGGRGRITLEDGWNAWGTNGTNGNKLWILCMNSGLDVGDFNEPLPKAFIVEYVNSVLTLEMILKDGVRGILVINENNGSYTSTGWQEVRYADTEVIELNTSGTSLDYSTRDKVAANPEKYIFKVTYSGSTIFNAYYRFSSKEHFDGSADLGLLAADTIYYSAILKDDFGAYKVSNLKVYIQYHDNGAAKSASVTLDNISFNNYYTKDETYNKTEIDEAISNIPGGSGGASYNAGQDITIQDDTISTVYGGGYTNLEGEVSGNNTRTWHNGSWSDAPVSIAYRWFLYIGPGDYELGEDFWTLINDAAFGTRITFYINTGYTDLSNNYINIEGEFYATKVEDPEHPDCWILQFDENEYWDKWYLDTYEKGTPERPRLQCYGKGNYEWCLNVVDLSLTWTMIGNYVGYVPIDDNFISENIARTEQLNSLEERLNSLEERIAAIESIANAEGGAY